jgi:hypothetical protein
MQILEDPIVRYAVLATLAAVVLVLVFRIKHARIKRNKLEVTVDFRRHDKD